jgi:hypothetical protein
MKKLLFASILSVLFSLAASAQTVTGSITGGTAARGSTTRGSIFLNIPSGLHVNSSRPDKPYAIPTSVRLSAAGARIGSISYPRGHDRKFAFSETPINVYEGRTPITFSLIVPSGYSGRTVRVRAVVRYQACTDEVCYPPQTKEITISARVR